MGLTPDDIDTLREATAFDSAGQKLGEVSQVYLDDTTGDPSWVTVRTGLFGTQETFVPLRGAASRSGELHVPVDKATVKDAPRIDADGHLTPDEEQELYRYYDIDDGRKNEATMGGGGVDPEDRERPGDPDGVRDERAGLDESSPAATGPVVTGTPSTPRSVDDADDGVRDDRASADDGDVDDDRNRDHDRRAETRAETDNNESDDTESDESSRLDDSADSPDLDALSAGETQSRLRRYVVTERVTRTVEELPDDDSR